MLKTNIQNFPAELAAFLAAVTAIIAVLKKYGIWDDILSLPGKILSKLKIPSSVAIHINEQDKDKALSKLQISDDVVTMLEEYATDSLGKIDIEKAALVLNDQWRLKTLIGARKARTLTDSEKDEALNIVSRVMCLYKE